MKKTMSTIWSVTAGLSLLAALAACNKKLDKVPQGSLTLDNVATSAGVNALLVGAYAILDGENLPAAGNAYGSAGSNWVYGSVAADDSYKGSTPTDQPNATEIESWSISQANTATAYLNEKWTVLFNGIQRANDVIRTSRLAKDISDTAPIIAEARFLRGFYHFEGKKVFNHFPFADETVYYGNGLPLTPNNTDIWPLIDDDLFYAVANLPETQPQVGRVNKWAAMAFLAKAYMFQHKYDSAKTLLDQVIASGVTSSGEKYALVNFESNFNAPQKTGRNAFLPVRIQSMTDQPPPMMAATATLVTSLIFPTAPAHRAVAAVSTILPGTSPMLIRPMLQVFPSWIPGIVEMW